MDVAVKAAMGLITAMVSLFTGLFGMMFTVLLGLMAIDLLTGVLAGAYTEGLSSSRGYRGLFKKLYTMLLIGSVFLIELAVLQSHGIITDGISGAFCLMEFVSILENGGRLGVPLPEQLKKLVALLKNKVEEKVEEKLKMEEKTRSEETTWTEEK
ncbi:phage holin family protein [Paenibacillus sabuli]|nr:phage holin family protein [Paenibacillus sabuli]